MAQITCFITAMNSAASVLAWQYWSKSDGPEIH